MRTSSTPSVGWRLFLARAVRAPLVVAIVAAAVLVDAGTAEAIRIPSTLADRRSVQTGPVEPGFPIDYLGALWDTRDYQSVAAGQDHEDESHGAVRFRHDGVWGPWVPLVEDGADAAGQWASGLIPAGDADAYQVRGVPAWAVLPRAVALNTTDGPLVTVGTRPAGAAQALGNCLSRAEWGADESLRFSEDGDDNTEVWPLEFYPMQVTTVHHTAGSNNDPDPAATVRAIYRFHAVDRGWGDIGYHYLVDEQGRIYEGRWSGSKSTRCDTGGDGTDFAHNPEGLLVTGGHTEFHNQGNLGIALLGNFTDVEPKAAARSALENALAELAERHGLDPLGIVNYYNPVHNISDTVDTISGHRDWRAVACPGDRFYPLLPDVRVNVAALIGHTVGLVDPTQGKWYLRNSSGQVTSFFYGNPDDIPFMGDWDCDSIATPGLFRQSDAFAYLRNSNTQGIADIRFFFGNPDDIPLAGDFNGDGCDTLSLYRPSEQRFYMINKLGKNEGGLGAAEFSFLFGNPGDKPVVGDWDGDGIDEIGLHRESTGFFYFRNTLTQGIADGEIFFGDPGDRFVAGDWGIIDGVDTPAVFRPSNTTFFFRHTLTQGVADSQFGFGESPWLPVSGKFGLG